MKYLNLFENFDFTISCCAYYKNDLYMTNECLRNISRNQLSMNQKRFKPENFGHEKQMYQVHTLFSRIVKYKARYELDIGETVYNLLHQIKENIDKSYFKIERDEASVVNSAGDVEYASTELNMWNTLREVLSHKDNPYKEEFEEYLT